MECRVGDWVWSKHHGEAGQVVAVEELWGLRTLRLWLPSSDSIVRVTSEAVSAVAERPAPNEHELSFIAAAARIADTLSTDALLAPVESKVIPLPHQLHALSRALSGDRVRFLLADEVGLGKTIEAGLIMRELKLRGLVERILVVAPAGLATQWVSEMRTHFSEEFQLLVPGEMASLRRLHGVDESENLWRRWNQVVCPLDSVKPMERRKGWSFREVQAYNRERFVDLVAAGWDLVVIDEAHRLGGSSEQVARYKLGELSSKQQDRVRRERTKGEEAFRVRRKALDHVGLDAVRQYRVRQLEQEHAVWQERLDRRGRIVPELTAVCAVRVGATPGGAGAT